MLTRVLTIKLLDIKIYTNKAELRNTYFVINEPTIYFVKQCASTLKFISKWSYAV
jgi:hypothetical protein